MIKEIDGRKKVCPEPVILTKNELDKEEVKETITIVDNKVAKDNISKLAKSLNYKHEIEEVNNNYHIRIIKTIDNLEDLENKNKEISDIVLGVSSNLMGSGDDKLGKILMKSYIYTVSQTKPYPKAIVFFNSGVKLTCKDSEVLEDLQVLDNAGVEIISCGTCLNFYKLEKELSIGTISNMYEIYEKLNNKNIII